MTTFFYNIFNFQEENFFNETLIKPHLVHDALNENSFNYIYSRPVKANFN